jgi:hypothetical protein
MAMTVLGLALYLWGLANRGKSLKDKNATLRSRRIYGIVFASPMLIAPLYFSFAGTLGGWGILFVWVWSVTCAVLGYITVAHAPKWIVGVEKK